MVCARLLSSRHPPRTALQLKLPGRITPRAPSLSLEGHHRMDNAHDRRKTSSCALTSTSILLAMFINYLVLRRRGHQAQHTGVVGTSHLLLNETVKWRCRVFLGVILGTRQFVQYPNVVGRPYIELQYDDGSIGEPSTVNRWWSRRNPHQSHQYPSLVGVTTTEQ